MPPDRETTLEWDAEQRGQVLGEPFIEALKPFAEKGIDLVCFTGDVADWGHPAEYKKATERIDCILEAIKVPRSRFFAVPGNHDVQRRVQEAAWRGIRGWLEATPDRSQLGRWFRGVGDPPVGLDPPWRGGLLERTAEFWKWVESFCGEGFLSQGAVPLGYRKTLQPGTFDHVEEPIHIVGLDSAWLCGAEEAQDGTVFKDQGSILVTEEQVEAHTRDGENVVDGFLLALIHHPLHELADYHAVQRCLGDCGVEILLHGHQHTPVSMTVDEPGARLQTLASGCLIEGGRGRDWPNGFQLLEWDLVSAAGVVHFRKWSKGGRFWAPGSDIYRQAPQGTLQIGDCSGGCFAEGADRPSRHSRHKGKRRGSGITIGLVAVALFAVSMFVVPWLTAAPLTVNGWKLVYIEEVTDPPVGTMFERAGLKHRKAAVGVIVHVTTKSRPVTVSRLEINGRLFLTPNEYLPAAFERHADDRKEHRTLNQVELKDDLKRKPYFSVDWNVPPRDTARVRIDGKTEKFLAFELTRLSANTGMSRFTYHIREWQDLVGFADNSQRPSKTHKNPAVSLVFNLERNQPCGVRSGITDSLGFSLHAGQESIVAASSAFKGWLHVSPKSWLSPQLSRMYFGYTPDVQCTFSLEQRPGTSPP